MLIPDGLLFQIEFQREYTKFHEAFLASKQTEVEIQKKDVDSKLVANVLEALKDTTATKLVLCFFHAMSQGAASALATLPSNIKTVDLAYLGLSTHSEEKEVQSGAHSVMGSNGVLPFVEALSGTEVESLTLHGMGIQTEDAEPLAKAVQASKLTHLCLRKNGLGPSFLKAFADALGSEFKPRSIDLSYNPLKGGIIDFVKALKAINAKVTLNLEHTSIEPEVVQQLLKELSGTQIQIPKLDDVQPVTAAFDRLRVEGSGIGDISAGPDQEMDEGFSLRKRPSSP